MLYNVDIAFMTHVHSRHQDFFPGWGSQKFACKLAVKLLLSFGYADSLFLEEKGSRQRVLGLFFADF
jgi:hypothetical protein